MDFPELESLQLSKRKNRNMDSFTKQLADLDLDTVMLQKLSISFASAWKRSYGVVDNFPEF